MDYLEWKIEIAVEIADVQKLKTTLFIIDESTIIIRSSWVLSNTWIMRFSYRCKQNRTVLFKPEIKIINFVIPFYSDKISEKWMENTMSHLFPWWKATPIQSHVKPFILFTISVRLEEAGSFTDWSHVHNIYEIKRGLVCTKLRIRIFSEEH